MPSKPEVEQYIKDNAIEAALAAAVSATVKARPLDALAYLSQELAKATKPVAPCFFTVYHTFVPDKAAAWWEQMMKMGPDDYRAMDLKNNKLGFHCHSFMPAGMEGPINCMWECKVDTTPEVFQAFIDGPDGPGPGVVINKCYKVMPGAILPPSHFKGKCIFHAKEATAGSMFWVFHEFKPNHAGKFWEWIQTQSDADMGAMHARNNGNGMHNHSFCPGGPDGPTICIWESAKPMEAAEMQAWIDGPHGPGYGVDGVDGSVFVNKVHKMMQGGNPPSAKFTLKESIARTFGAGAMDGSALTVSADKATMAPPGAPPMALPMMLGMVDVVKGAFPQWEALVHFVELQGDGTCIVGTQQCSGPMVADMPAMGPFPEVKLETAPELAKKGVVFPVEVGRYTFNVAGDKVQNGAYFGEYRLGVGREPTPEVLAMWNKKGDLSDVGFGALYQVMLGAPLPAPPPLAPPESIARFFNGEAMTADGKADWLMKEGFADYMTTAFVGPFAPPVPMMDKAKLEGAMGNLLGSFPDLTFNVKKVSPKQDKTGAWAADIVVEGTHTGAPFSPMPGMLPAIEPKGTKVIIGPETFTLAADADGKIYSMRITPLHEGKPAGPPGFYLGIGGQLPSPPF
jgi:hypothetical protein